MTGTAEQPQYQGQPEQARTSSWLFSGRADVIVGAPGLYHDNRSDRVECDKGSGGLAAATELEPRRSLPAEEAVGGKTFIGGCPTWGTRRSEIICPRAMRAVAVIIDAT